MESGVAMRPSKEILIPLAALLLGLLATRAFASDAPTSEKMARQIGVMEKILNEVLVESPNFFIQERENARGMYVKDLGLVFTFSVSLVDKDWDLDKILKWDKVNVKKHDDGSYSVETEDDEEHDEDDEEIPTSDELLKKQERTYMRGKTELLDLILDYGDTLTTLDAGKWLVFVGFMRGSDYFEEKNFSRLVLKAKIDDLRAYGAEKISEEEMLKRIQQITY
jgi:hypothetical protein